MAVRLWPAGAGESPDPVVAADPATVTIVAGTPASIDPARHGDLGSASFVSQLYEIADGGRPVAGRPPGPRRVVDHRRGRPPGHLHAPRRPRVQRRHAAHRRRRRPQLAPPVHARQPVAARLADRGHRRRPRPAERRVDGRLDPRRARGGRPDGRRRPRARRRQTCRRSSPSAPFAIVPAVGGRRRDRARRPASWSAAAATRSTAVDEDAFVLRGEPALLGGQARHRDGPDADHPRRPAARSTRSSAGERRRDADRVRRRRLDRLRPRPRAVAAQRPVAVGHVLRLRHARAAVRRPAGPPGLRQGRRLARLAALDEPGSSVAATGMVPAGMPGAPEGDFLPDVRPGRRPRAARARRATRPAPTSARSRSSPTARGYDQGIVTMLEQNLGVTIDYATMDFATYQARLASDPPRMWSISWVADYPGPNDFLGVLLGTGSTANQGGWSSPEFDAAIAEATSAADPETATAAYAKAHGDRARPGAGGARQLRHVVLARPRRAARARARTASGSCGSPASPGRTADDARCGPRPSALVAVARRRGPGAGAVGRPRRRRGLVRQARSPSPTTARRSRSRWTSPGPCRSTRRGAPAAAPGHARPAHRRRAGAARARARTRCSTSWT